MFMRLKDVIQATGLSRSTIYEMMKSKSFPANVRIGARVVAWLTTDIEEWAKNRCAQRRIGQ